jgi:hypothetical protein
MKKVYDKKWGLLKDKHSFYWIPTIVTVYNPYTFLETGVCTPSFTIMIKFLKYSLGFSIQESY